MDTRIKFLDGIRGLAILLVVLFHTFLSPIYQGETYSSFPVFKYGYFGVQLFFLLSGFVILMTLEKNKSFFTFIYKRWLRLFPAVLIVSPIILLTAHFFYETRQEIPNIYSLLPQLLFLEPEFLSKIVGFHIIPLQGAFWTLFIEMKFYIFFGFCYFVFGRNKAILCLCLIFLYALTNALASLHHSGYLLILSSSFGWFASGCCAYIYYTEKNKNYLYLSLLLGALNLYASFCLRENSPSFLIVGAAIISLFYITVVYKNSRVILDNRFFVFFGFISYPLYLIHENIIISSTVKLSILFPLLPKITLPLIPFFALSVLSYAIAQIEPYLKKNIDKKIRSIKIIRKILS